MSIQSFKHFLYFTLLGLVAGVAAPLESLAQPVSSQFEGRPLVVSVPDHWASGHPRAMVLVLHGGMGNSERILGEGQEHALDLDRVAGQDGFLVAYVDGTHAARMLPQNFLAWNAGICCGLPAKSGVDDVAYLEHLVAALVARYQIDAGQVFAIGHSNGAMMGQRMICESDAIQRMVAVSGPLDLGVDHCPRAAGKWVLAIHGASDANVPLGGGVGERGISRIDYPAEQQSRDIMTASGARYDLEVLPGVDHNLGHIETAIEAREKRSLGEKAADFFGLSPAAGPS